MIAVNLNGVVTRGVSHPIGAMLTPEGVNFCVSWNCGVEGPTEDPDVEELRRRQIKNFLTITLLSLGVPMLLMGDEVRRTQLGNNNAYCQDNEISWFDWTRIDQHRDILRFAKKLISFRLSLPVSTEEHGLTLWELLHRSRIEFHGVRTHQPDTGHGSRSLAVSVWGERAVYYLILNAYWEELGFELPSLTAPLAASTTGDGRTGWRRIIDTSVESPDDCCDFEEAPLIEMETYHAGPRSVVLLASEKPAGH